MNVGKLNGICSGHNFCKISTAFLHYKNKDSNGGIDLKSILWKNGNEKPSIHKNSLPLIASGERGRKC